ncbi:MAG: TolC family protein [Planctomycetaceae bacterium]
MTDRMLYTAVARLFQSLAGNRQAFRRRTIGVFCTALLAGCANTNHRVVEKTIGNDTCEVDSIMKQVDNPSPPVPGDLFGTTKPVSAMALREPDKISYQDMTLSSALYTGLSYSKVLRDIGGTILRSPDTVATSVSRQLQQTDPRFGAEAALSAFDAQLAARANFNQNDRLYNNSFFAGGTRAFNQDYNDYTLELSKRTATGSLMALRGVSNYDSNNAPANTFYSAWDSWLEGELRQPLLQGGGLEFNRIAGPGSTPGVYNGVLIAKVNSDITDAEFQTALRDYISNVENAYWDLYLAYREYDARKNAFEGVKARFEEKKKGGQTDEVEFVLLQQQMYQLKTEADDALFGRLLTGTQVRNGSTGGTLQSGGGVLGAERRLRLLIGLPVSEQSVLRPTEDPTTAEVKFDWESAIQEALTQRPELQKQNNAVKKRELELVAARNFLNPRLDAVGRYRFRGFGNDLIADGNQHNGVGAPVSSVGNLMTGDQQEWAVGVELTVPLGYRKAHAAVSHAELNLARERMIQKEQQREILSNLSGAFTDVERTYAAMETSLDQYLAARKYHESIQAQVEEGKNVLEDRILDGYRRMVLAEVQFFRARAEYAIALKNFHYEKGSLLDYKDLRMAGGQMAMGDSAIPQDDQFNSSVSVGEPQSSEEEAESGVAFDEGATGFEDPQADSAAAESSVEENEEGVRSASAEVSPEEKNRGIRSVANGFVSSLPKFRRQKPAEAAPGAEQSSDSDTDEESAVDEIPSIHFEEVPADSVEPKSGFAKLDLSGDADEPADSEVESEGGFEPEQE